MFIGVLFVGILIRLIPDLDHGLLRPFRLLRILVHVVVGFSFTVEQGQRLPSEAADGTAISARVNDGTLCVFLRSQESMAKKVNISMSSFCLVVGWGRSFCLLFCGPFYVAHFPTSLEKIKVESIHAQRLT